MHHQTELTGFVKAISHGSVQKAPKREFQILYAKGVSLYTRSIVSIDFEFLNVSSLN